MRAGELKEVVELWRKTTVKNKYNENEENYVLARTMRAAVNEKESRQCMVGRSEQIAGAAVLQLRWYQDVAITDRIAWRGQMWEVESVVPMRDRQMMEVMMTWRAKK